MRMSDLLRSHVVDSDGKSVGRVEDVRLVQDGPLQGGFGAAFRIEGLLVGRGGLGARLGFVRAGVRGPAPLRAMIVRLENESRFVAWQDVVSCEDRVVKLNLSRDEVTEVGPD